MSKKQFSFQGYTFDEEFDGFKDPADNLPIYPFETKKVIWDKTEKDSQEKDHSYTEYLESAKSKAKFQEDLSKKVRKLALKVTQQSNASAKKSSAEVYERLDADILRLREAFEKFLTDAGITKVRTRKKLFDMIFSTLVPFIVSILDNDSSWDGKYNVIGDKINTLTNYFGK